MNKIVQIEIWKDIKGYENKYQISNLGKVKSLSRKVKCGNGYKKTEERILRQNKDNRGYLMVNLYKDNTQHTIKTHRLVANAFIPNHLNLPQINHKDEEKTNNTASNLEWCTNSYNCNYGTHNERMAKALSKTVYQYSMKNTLIKVWVSAIQCSRENNIFNHRHISECCLGKRKTHKGYKWSYELLRRNA